MRSPPAAHASIPQPAEALSTNAATALPPDQRWRQIRCATRGKGLPPAFDPNPPAHDSSPAPRTPHITPTQGCPGMQDKTTTLSVAQSTAESIRGPQSVPGALVVCHLLRDFELAAASQILRDAGCAEVVKADFRLDLGVGRAPRRFGSSALGFSVPRTITNARFFMFS